MAQINTDFNYISANLFLLSAKSLMLGSFINKKEAHALEPTV